MVESGRSARGGASQRGEAAQASLVPSQLARPAIASSRCDYLFHKTWPFARRRHGLWPGLLPFHGGSSVVRLRSGSCPSVAVPICSRWLGPLVRVFRQAEECVSPRNGRCSASEAHGDHAREAQCLGERRRRRGSKRCFCFVLASGIKERAASSRRGRTASRPLAVPNKCSTTIVALWRQQSPTCVSRCQIPHARFRSPAVPIG